MLSAIRSRMLQFILPMTAVTSLQSPIAQPMRSISTRFILIDTKHPGNVGAVARGMKTMGFSELILVSPNDERVLGRKKCIDGASGASDILKSAVVYKSLEEVLDGNDNTIICGTGMPVDMQNERPQQQYVPPRKFFEELLSRENMDGLIENNLKCQDIQIAFLFGNERFGMKAEDMERCEVMLGIPTNPSFGSLNLASAVQIIAYDWREAIGGFAIEKGC